MGLYLKIEVAPLEKEQQDLMQYRKRLFISKFRPKLGNAKKPETVQNKKIEEFSSFLTELDSKEALTPFLSKVVTGAILIISEDDSGTKQLIKLVGTEKEMLYIIADTILKEKSNHSLITFNGSTFDIPFIITRMIMTGVSPHVIDRFNYATKFHVDLLYLLGRVQYGNMSFENFIQMKFGKIFPYPWMNYENFCKKESITDKMEGKELYLEYLSKKSVSYVKHLYYAFTKEEFDYSEKFENIIVSEDVNKILDIITDSLSNEVDEKEATMQKPGLEDGPLIQESTAPSKKEKKEVKSVKEVKSNKIKSTKKTTKKKEKVVKEKASKIKIKEEKKDVSIDDL